jgi:hypothetical protein
MLLVLGHGISSDILLWNLFKAAFPSPHLLRLPSLTLVNIRH